MDANKVSRILASKLGHEDFKLDSYKVIPIFGLGLLGEHLKLECAVLDHKSQTIDRHYFFIKGISNLEIFNDFPIKVQMKEIEVYKAFRAMDNSLIDNATAICYHTDEKYLVLDDLTASGYAVKTTQDIPTVDEMLVILKSLADVHAGTIIYEEQRTKLTGKVTRVNLEFPRAFIEEHMNPHEENIIKWYRALEGGMKTATEVFDLKYLKNGKLYRDEVKRLWDVFDHIQPSVTYRNVVCHCDLWAANVFIHYASDGKPEHAKIVDYQITRYLPPALDVLLVMLLHCSREFRQLHMRQLQAKYFEYFADNLKQSGVDPSMIYTYDQFLESFKEVEFLAVLLNCSAVSLVYIERDEIAKLLNGDAYEKIVLEDRSPLMVNFKNNEFYMTRVHDSMLDFKDYLERVYF